MKVLKELYKDCFKVGVACEKINGSFTTHEIGNPSKEKLMASQFNSMTCANELKPAYNMAFDSPEATEEKLPFAINPQAKAMLDWAKENNLKVRGHVLLWHSQCPKEIFCKNYEPVTFPTDPEILKEKPFMKMFEKLNPVCFVSREVLLARLESYIFSLMDYMYANGYSELIYAWDVVNEAIELDDKTPLGLRNTYWYQIIGDDLIYWAFRYAKNAVDACMKKYGTTAKPALFYNDYNEWISEKKKAITDILLHESHGHGSVVGEGLLDGIGMQAHLSDNVDLKEYEEALYDYSKIAGEIHLTELDVKCTCADENRFYYQAVFYKKLFETLLKVRKNGVNVSSVTFWGLTDDNSWIRGEDPLLFDKELAPKKSFDAVTFALTGESLGDPILILRNLSDRKYTFDVKDTSIEDMGFGMRGHGMPLIEEGIGRNGSNALAVKERFAQWMGVTFNASDFVGQTIKVRACVKSPALEVRLEADMGGNDSVIAKVDTANGEWNVLEGKCKVPKDMHSFYMIFRTTEAEVDKLSPLYIDEFELELVGLEESFEEDTNIASVRGTGHLPVLFVTADESHDGKSHSLGITRQEKEATVKFNVTPYIGTDVEISMYVKTTDSLIRMGIDAEKPLVLAEKATASGEWNLVKTRVCIPKDMKNAYIYVETDGNADYYVDDICVFKSSSL